MRKIRLPGAVLAIAALAVSPMVITTPAFAQGKSQTEELRAALADVPTEYAVNSSNVQSLSSEVAAGDLLPVLNSSGEATGVAIRQVDTGENQSVQPLEAGREAVIADGETSTVAQQKTDGSVQIVTTLGSSSAPKQFTYDLTLPAGTALQVLDDGAVAAIDPGGEFVAGVRAPWAVDADGDAVPTHFVVEGNRLVQVVEHDAEDTFPVVADPWLGVDLYGPVTATDTADGYVLTTTPTLWAAGYSNPQNVAIWWAHSDEVKNKVPSGYAWSLSLQEQLYCHIAGYPVSANPSYDLESWKPHVQWQNQIESKCLGGYSVGS